MDAVKVQEQHQAFRAALSGFEDPALERVSAELDKTHRQLTRQVVRLTAELEAARMARREEHAKREDLLARLASLLDALPGGVLIIDDQGRVSEFNPQAAALLGEPIEGERWATLESRGQYVSEGTFAIHGRRLSVKSTVLGDDGETVILLSDITFQHTLQDELGRKQRLAALGEMAARLAHQIRTPLSSTTLYLSQLDSDIPADRRSRICGSLKEQLAHMEALVTSMLGFVKGQHTPFEEVYLAEVIADALESCSAEIESSHALIDIDACGPDVSILGCHDDLVAAITNLITNAIEASGAKPKIEICARAVSKNMALVRVSDEGRGIPEGSSDRIFDPFYTTRSRGTGLGLAVVASTIAQHGGTVYASNREEGGAQFNILLPTRAGAALFKEQAA